MDPVTLTEAVIVGNPRAGEANLRKVAIAKLEMQLQKKWRNHKCVQAPMAIRPEILSPAPSVLNPKVVGISKLQLW